MRIPCPHCGWRDAADFVYGGDAAARLIPRAGDDEPWLQQLYLRRNPCGEHEELWFHEQGCGRWLLARRDTRSHRLLAVRAADAAGWQRLEPLAPEQEVQP